MKTAIAIVATIVWLSFSVWIAHYRYAECRAHGFSPFYCMTDMPR